MRRHLFDIEMAVERVAEAAARGSRDSDPAAACRQLDVLAAALLHRDQRAGLGREGAAPVPPPADLPGRLGLALHDLRNAIDGRPAGDASAAQGEPEANDPPSDGRGGLHPLTRRGLQATIAAALALGAGYLLSPNRWFWTVLTAYLVLLGTQSRGEILTRASVQGVLGAAQRGELAVEAARSDREIIAGLAGQPLPAGFDQVAQGGHDVGGGGPDPLAGKGWQHQLGDRDTDRRPDRGLSRRSSRNDVVGRPMIS